jgi:hypothetical protein
MQYDYEILQKYGYGESYFIKFKCKYLDKYLLKDLFVAVDEISPKIIITSEYISGDNIILMEDFCYYSYNEDITLEIETGVGQFEFNIDFSNNTYIDTYENENLLSKIDELLSRDVNFNKLEISLASHHTYVGVN